MNATNLNRFSTYNLACDFKDQIQEVERNWDADLHQLEKAKRIRIDMQERVQNLRTLLDYERETTANMERTLQKTKVGLGTPDWEASFDSSFDSNAAYEGSHSFSPTSIYSETGFSLVYNPSAAQNLHFFDNVPVTPALATEGDHTGPSLGVSLGPQGTPKPTRSAQWKQLIASFLPNTLPQRPTSLSSGDNSVSTETTSWGDTAEEVSGRFTRRNARC